MPALSRYHNTMSVRRGLRVIFFVEGFTDIRFVVGLSRICELTMIVPARPYVESGLAERVADSGASLRVIEVAGRQALVPVPIAGASSGGTPATAT